RTIPATLHFQRPNLQVDFAASPFFVNAEPIAWESNGGRRRAAVHSFGMGGTNAHVILEEAPAPEPTTPSRPLQMLVLSARSAAALEAATDRLASHLVAYPEADLADVAYTLHMGRRGFGHRRVALAASREEAVRVLTERDPRRVFTAAGGDREQPVFFLFPGQGTQYVNMARGLYEAEPVFRDEVVRCAQLLEPRLGLDLREVLFPGPERAAEAAERLGQTAAAQAALFTVEHALAKLWMEWGLRPQGMVGSGSGEHVAACLTGVISLEDALEALFTAGLQGVELQGSAGNLGRFASSAPEGLLLEVGPGSGLATLASRYPALAGRVALSSLRGAQEEEPPDQEHVLRTLGQLWLAGIVVDWRAFYARERRRRVPLPTYPFERRRYWIEPGAAARLVAATTEPGEMERQRVGEAGHQRAEVYHPRPSLGTSYVAPRTETERAIVSIWRDLFGIAEIGVDDDFFDLGGHSLLATQVTSRIRATLGVELPLQRLFEAPTVRGLARAVEQTRLDAEAASLPPVSPVPRDGGALPLSFAQERMWFLHRLDPGLTAYNLMSAARLRGKVDPLALARCIDALSRRHEALRTVFAPSEDGPRQIIQPPAIVPLFRVDLSLLSAGVREKEAERCARILTDQPFDLTTGPLFRALLIHLAPDDQVFAISVHHIVADAWALLVVLSELSALYAAYLAGQPSPLPGLAFQYADFAVWQRRWLAGERLAGQLDFWRRQLAGAPPLLELPT